MKVLTICSAGTVRSVGMAHRLKFSHGIDAVPVGADANSPETIAMLSDWADVIIPMQPAYAGAVPKGNHHKITAVDVGPDVWGSALDPDLQKKVGSIIRKLREQNII